MIDIAKSGKFRNFTILNEALLFWNKLNKTAVQSVSYTFQLFCNAVSRLKRTKSLNNHKQYSIKVNETAKRPSYFGSVFKQA